MININNKNIKRIQTAITVIIVVLIIIDIILVTTKDKYPTFSKVIYTERPQLLWLTFIFGALVSKIFFNKYCNAKSHEYWGLIILFIITVGLFITGKLITIETNNLIQLTLLVLGGVLSHFLWPQHTNAPLRIT